MAFQFHWCGFLCRTAFTEVGSCLLYYPEALTIIDRLRGIYGEPVILPLPRNGVKGALHEYRWISETDGQLFIAVVLNKEAETDPGPMFYHSEDEL